MFAYLDAATGSMIVSAIAGGAAGLSVAGKMGMKRLKGKLSRSGDADVVVDADQAAVNTDETAPTTVDASS